MSHVRFVERVPVVELDEGTELGNRERGPSLKSLPAKPKFSDAETKTRSVPVTPQNVIIAAKCNINAKCNKNRRKM